MKNKNTPQQTIPFPLEGHTASREGIRAHSKNIDHLRKVDLAKILIRPLFNPRRQKDVAEDVYELMLGIPQLADGIFASNGPADPIVGDIHSDGNFYITEGERRTRALRHLLRTERELYPNGSPVCEVTALLNPPKTTDLERKCKALAADNKMKLKPMELAYYYLSFKTDYKKTHQEISDLLGRSRQTIDNYILAATELSQEVQDDIDVDKIKISTALADYRASHKKPEPKEKPDKPKKEEKDPDGDEDDFKQKDNSITGASSMGGPKETSGQVIAGKDSIFKDQEDTARWKQFINRYEFINKQSLESCNGDIDEAQKKNIELLKQEFVLQLK